MKASSILKLIIIAVVLYLVYSHFIAPKLKH